MHIVPNVEKGVVDSRNFFPWCSTSRRKGVMDHFTDHVLFRSRLLKDVSLVVLGSCYSPSGGK